MGDKAALGDARSLVRVARSLADTEGITAQLGPGAAAIFVEAVDVAVCRFAPDDLPATPTVRHAVRTVTAYMLQTLMARARQQHPHHAHHRM